MFKYQSIVGVCSYNINSMSITNDIKYVLAIQLIRKAAETVLDDLGEVK